MDPAGSRPKLDSTTDGSVWSTGLVVPAWQQAKLPSSLGAMFAKLRENLHTYRLLVRRHGRISFWTLGLFLGFIEAWTQVRTYIRIRLANTNQSSLLVTSFCLLLCCRYCTRYGRIYREDKQIVRYVLITLLECS